MVNEKYINAVMPDGSVWEINFERVKAIVLLEHFKLKIDKEEAVNIDAVTDDEIIEIAEHLIDWSHLCNIGAVTCIKLPAQVDYQRGWETGKKSIVSKTSGGCCDS